MTSEDLAAAVAGAAAERAIAEIRAAIRQPSVSRTGEGIEAMAAQVADRLRALGAEARLVPAHHAPIVEGELRSARADAPTLLFYELYDVQPAAGQPGWSVPPFAGAIVTDAAGRRRIVGRGAFNSKGPLVGALEAIRAMREAGLEMPCHIRFLIEGEEEVGSPGLPDYIAANHAALAACQGAAIPYFGTTPQGETVLRLGFKGLALLEISVEGGAWGGPARGDVHALHGALVDSPSWELVRALATLADARGQLRVDGLAIPPPSPADLALVEEAARHFDPAAYGAALGVTRVARAGDPAAALRDLMFSVTLNIDALEAGRIEEGGQAATTIPRRARALADLRVVPGIRAEDVVALIRAHLARRGFGHVQVALRSAYPASRSAPDAPVVRAMIDACRAEAQALRVFPIHAGAAPMHLFSEVIGIPYAFGGVGHGGGSHGPDEYIMADDVAPFMRAFARFLVRFGEAARC